jgi:hypothetical protein
VNKKTRPWTVTLPVILCCVAILAALVYYRSKRPIDGAQLVRMAPAGPAMLVYIDVDALRRIGVLNPSSGIGNEEPEYRAFTLQTGFDYRKDLDAVVASYRGDDSFYLAMGRFDWNLIKGYAVQAGGSCWDAFCTVRASRPGRHISIMPLRSGVLAVAVAADRSAVKTLVGLPKRAERDGTPNAPVWISLPPSVLAKTDDFPVVTQLFVKGLQHTENVTLSIGPTGSQLQASLSVNCRNAQDAILLLAQMESITEELRKIQAGKAPASNPLDLASVLARGLFRRDDRFVFGTWPVERGFLDSLTGGAL